MTTTTMETTCLTPPSNSRRPVLRHSNNLHCGGFLEQFLGTTTTQEPPHRSRPRPVLRHSNNLHCGSFLEQYTSCSGEKENSGERRRRSKSVDDEQALRNRFRLYQYEFSPEKDNHDEDVLGRIVSEKHEWGKFHRALREKRSRCSTHASIQQCINKLVEDQGRQMEEKDESMSSSAAEMTPRAEEDPQHKVYHIYRKAVILSRQNQEIIRK
jgi:hypothetical protein